MSMNRSIVLFVAVSVYSAMALPVVAKDATLFFEDFEGVSFVGGASTAPGLPLESDGAKERWFGGTFEPPVDGVINSDLSVQLNGGGTNTSKTAAAEDDRGLFFEISTTGFTDVVLTFDWRNFQGEPDKTFVASYFVGDISGLSDADRFKDLQTTNFTKILEARSTDWTPSTFLGLPEDTPKIYVAFWSNGSKDDFIFFDNVKVDANYIVPLPAAAWMGLSLLAGMGFVRRWRC